MNDPSNSDTPPCAREAEELARIEAELASFAPGAGRLNRDRVLFLAGRASTSRRTPAIAPAPAARVWRIGFGAMTAAAASLLVALMVQHRELAALRTAGPGSTDRAAPAVQLAGPREPQEESKPGATASRAVNAATDESPAPLGPGFSQECLLAMADSGPLSVRSLITTEEPPTRAAPRGDWPQYPCASSPPPLPYYKLLRQFQQRGVR